MHETSPPSRWGEARGSGWGPPRPTALQTHCRPAGTRRASRDAHRQRPDVPTEVYDPSTQAPRRLRRPVRPDMTRRSKRRTDDARRAPAAGAAGRPVSIQIYRGELPKTSTVISISSTRLYVLHTSCCYTPTTHRRTPVRPRPPSSGMCRIPSRTRRRMLI